MVTIPAFKFATPDGAEQMLGLVKDLTKQQLITLQDAAIVTWPQGKKKTKTKQLQSLVGVGAHGWALLAGVVGVLGGLAMLTRGLTSTYLAQELVFSLIGGVMALTGVLHTFGGFRVGEGAHRNLTPTSILLGIFEIILGLMLVFEPMGRSTFFYLAASIWAFIGGFILIGEAIRLRRAVRPPDQQTNG